MRTCAGDLILAYSCTLTHTGLQLHPSLANNCTLFSRSRIPHCNLPPPVARRLATPMYITARATAASPMSCGTLLTLFLPPVALVLPAFGALCFAAPARTVPLAPALCIPPRIAATSCSDSQCTLICTQITQQRSSTLQDDTFTLESGGVLGPDAVTAAWSFRSPAYLDCHTFCAGSKPNVRSEKCADGSKSGATCAPIGFPVATCYWATRECGSDGSPGAVHLAGKVLTPAAGRVPDN